jgi:RNA polymerase sigma-70 factor (ECF subfamily)
MSPPVTATTGPGAAQPGQADGIDPDRDLVRRAREGEQAAFEQLVVNHQRRAFNVAYRILGDYDEALDLAQEAFLQAQRALRQFRGEARFGAWFLAIVVNLCRNRLKHWKRRARARHDSLSDPIGEEGSDLHRELPDPGPTALDRLEARQLEELVREEMGQIDEEYRTVLVLRELQDVAYEEIAKILGVPVGTVKSRLHRGRAELHARLRRRLAPDPKEVTP